MDDDSVLEGLKKEQPRLRTILNRKKFDRYELDFFLNEIE